MARLCGRPIIEYLFDGLLRAGIRSATVTLGYLPLVLEQAYPRGYGELELEFTRERLPLGTAGSVANALPSGDGPVLVLSGDALCDFDFAQILRAHKDSGACATIAAVEVGDPREYGLIRTDEKGFVTGFAEKPGWSQAVGGLANTGIYVLEREALEKIPSGRSFDFAKDLFPMLLKEDKPLYCHRARGYWCDVGDIPSFLRASRDILDGKVAVAPGPKQQIPRGLYTIKPPVFFGQSVSIGEGAVVGPYAVLEDGVELGHGARVRYSVLMPGAFVGEGSRVTGSLLCRGATVMRGAGLLEGSVLGENAVAGEESRIEAGVRVWPGKKIERGCTAREHIRFGGLRHGLFGESGMEADGRLSPRQCAAIGAAMAQVPQCARAALANDGSPRARALSYALCAGLQYGGASVWDFGESFPAQMNYCAAFGGRDLAVFVGKGSLIPYGEGGLPLPRYTERSIEAAWENGDEHPAAQEEIRDRADMGSLRAVYKKALEQLGRQSCMEGLELSVEGSNPLPRELLREVFDSLGCGRGESLVLRLNASGERLLAWTRESGSIPFEKLLALCCLDEFKAGRTIALPADAPLFLDSLAARHGCGLMRYLRSPSDKRDAAARRVAASCPWTRDGLFMAVKLAGLMARRQATLGQLLLELPQVHIRRSFAQGSPTRLAELDGKEGMSAQEAREGYLLIRGLAKLLIIPEKSGHRLRMLAEAESMEAAAELAADAERLLS
jgi:mannose-1-phosphate guanylyltransferase/phosphomannomutase